jgi:undecaprenyl-diphosphatase
MKDIKDEETVPYIQITRPQLIKSLVFFIITWSLALSLWYIKTLDKNILFALNNANYSNTIAIYSKFISRYGMALIVSVNLVLLLYTFKDENMKPLRPVFLLTILSYGIAGISGDMLKQVFNRSRPIITYAGELNFLTSSNSPAFPSGHASKSVALAFPLIFHDVSNNRLTKASKFVTMLIAILVCLSRIVLGAHYLSDVLAGAGWSVLCLPVSVLLTNRLLFKMSPERYELASRIWIPVYIALIIFVAVI